MKQLKFSNKAFPDPDSKFHGLKSCLKKCCYFTSFIMYININGSLVLPDFENIFC